MRDHNKALKATSLIFFISWLFCFVTGGIVRYIYDKQGGPDWFESIVGIFIGLGFCFMGLTALTSGFYSLSVDKYRKYQMKAIGAIVFSLPLLAIGIFVLYSILIRLSRI